VLLALGLLLTVPLAGGPITVGPLTFSLYWMLVGTALATLGLQSVYVGVLAQVLYDPTERVIDRWLKVLSYDRAVLGSALAFVCGVLLCVPLVFEYVRSGLKLGALTAANYLAVAGLLAAILSFMTFTFTLVLHALASTRRSVR
jgi:hypothetical protein